MAVLRTETATTVEEIPSTGRVQQAVITSGSVARLDFAGRSSEDASSLGVAISRRSSGEARRGTARRTCGCVGPGALGGNASFLSGEGAILGTAAGAIPRTLRIIVASRAGSVRALLGHARSTVLNVAGSILRACCEVRTVAPRTSLLACGSAVESADGSESSTRSFRGDTGTSLVARTRRLGDPEARRVRGSADSFGSDEVAVGDALAGASKPVAASTFGSAGRLSGEIPARSFALTSGGVPSAAINGGLSVAAVRSALSTSLGTARSVGVIPLAVLIFTAGRDISSISFRARARASSSSPQADVTRAFRGRGVGRARRSADGSRSSGVPNAVGVGVTVSHGVILVLARSGAASRSGVVVTSLETVSLEILAGSFVTRGVGFAILSAHGGFTSPHASGVSKASFLGRVLASTCGFTRSSGSVVVATSSGSASSVVSDLLARFNAGLGTISEVNKFAALVISTFFDVRGRVLTIAADLAVTSSPSADGVGEALGFRSRLGTSRNTTLRGGIPFAVVISLASLFRVVELITRSSTSRFECPVALSGKAVVLNTVHLASLFAGGVSFDVVTPSSITTSGTSILGEISWADLGNASLVGTIPFAFVVEVAGNVIRPLARSVDALLDGGVPVATAVSSAGRAISGEAESSTARASLGEPFALRIVVTRFTDTITISTSRHASTIRFNLTFAVLLAVSGGEDFTSTTAGLELTDPLAIRVGSTSRGISDGAASAGTFLALVIPQTVNISLALSGGGVGNRASGLASFVDLHALTVGSAASSITVELVAGSTAGTSGGVPLARRVGLAFSLTTLVSFRADGRASVGIRIPSASREFIATRFISRTTITDTVAKRVDSATLSRITR